MGIGGKAFEQAALAGRPPGVERGTEQGQQPGALALQEGALGLKPEPNGGLVYAGLPLQEAKAGTGRNKRANWMEPGAKAAGEGPEGEGLVPDRSRRLLLKEEPQISVVFLFFLTSLSRM